MKSKVKLGRVALVLLFLILASALFDAADAKSKACWGKCRARCKSAKVKWRCFKDCNICCAKCKCVPALGHIHQCPCYRHHRTNCP